MSLDENWLTALILHFWLLFVSADRWFLFNIDQLGGACWRYTQLSLSAVNQTLVSLIKRKGILRQWFRIIHADVSQTPTNWPWIYQILVTGMFYLTIVTRYLFIGPIFLSTLRDHCVVLEDNPHARWSLRSRVNNISTLYSSDLTLPQNDAGTHTHTSSLEPHN